jgi:hypothetical protein
MKQRKYPMKRKSVNKAKTEKFLKEAMSPTKSHRECRRRQLVVANIFDLAKRSALEGKPSMARTHLDAATCLTTLWWPSKKD